MLEPPDLPDEALAAALRRDYALRAVEIAFLPLGADWNTAVYRVVANADAADSDSDSDDGRCAQILDTSEGGASRAQMLGLLERGYAGWITLDLDPPRPTEGEGSAEDNLSRNQR